MDQVILEDIQSVRHEFWMPSPGFMIRFALLFFCPLWFVHADTWSGLPLSAGGFPDIPEPEVVMGPLGDGNWRMTDGKGNDEQVGTIHAIKAEAVSRLNAKEESFALMMLPVDTEIRSLISLIRAIRNGVEGGEVHFAFAVTSPPGDQVYLLATAVDDELWPEPLRLTTRGVVRDLEPMTDEEFIGYLSQVNMAAGLSEAQPVSSLNVDTNVPYQRFIQYLSVMNRESIVGIDLFPVAGRERRFDPTAPRPPPVLIPPPVEPK